MPEQTDRLFAEDPVFGVVDVPKRVIDGWTEREVDVARVYERDELRGYLWRGVQDRALGFVRADDSDEARATDDYWTALIRRASLADRFTTAGFVAYWLGFDNGNMAVSDSVERTTLDALMETVHRD